LERKLARTGLTQRFSALTRQNRPFRQALWRSLRAQRASPGMWLLINAGQLSHRLGKYYGALRS
jgi:hypothetical protein